MLYIVPQKIDIVRDLQILRCNYNICVYCDIDSEMIHCASLIYITFNLFMNYFPTEVWLDLTACCLYWLQLSCEEVLRKYLRFLISFQTVTDTKTKCYAALCILLTWNLSSSCDNCLLMFLCFSLCVCGCVGSFAWFMKWTHWKERKLLRSFTCNELVFFSTLKSHRSANQQRVRWCHAASLTNR